MDVILCAIPSRKSFLLFGIGVYQKVNIPSYIYMWRIKLSPTTKIKPTKIRSTIVFRSKMHTIKNTKDFSWAFFSVVVGVCSLVFLSNLSLGLVLLRCVAADIPVHLIGLWMCHSRLRLWPTVKFTMRIVWKKWESRVGLPKGTFYLFKHIHIKFKNTVNTLLKREKNRKKKVYMYVYMCVKKIHEKTP